MKLPHFSHVFLACVCLAAASLVGAARTLRAQGSAGTDPGYAATTDGEVLAVAAYPDGKAVIGGSFTTVNGAARSHVARLNADGSVDAGFVPAAVGTVTSLVVQSDGKIITASDVSQTDGTNYTRLTRFNTDGSADTGYAAPPDAPFRHTIILQPDGRLLVGGDTSSPDSTGYYAVVTRLGTNGQVDDSFHPTFDPGTEFDAFCLQADGKVVVAAHRSANGPFGPFPVVRFNADGSRDPAFSAVTDGVILSLAAQPDGRILARGNSFIERLDAAGAPDPSFKATFSGDFIYISLMALQPDGKIFVANYYGRPSLGIFFRLNPDGSRDDTFSFGPNFYPEAVAIQPDGSVIAGEFRGVARVVDYSPFFIGEVALGQSIYYLTLPNGNVFGYYGVLSDPRFIYHFDLGFEYVSNANDGRGGVYLYDFKSGDFFYTSPTFAFPYLYDFTLKAFLYYYPDPTNPQRYNTNGVRYFYNFATGKIITR